jgi:hypothetical protein
MVRTTSPISSFGALAWRGLRDSGNTRRHTTALFWAVLALLLWNVAIRPASAAPMERTCYEYPVTLHHVVCTLGWCSSFETLHINGRSVLTVQDLRPVHR